ncbi:MAG TPA: MtrAB system histidine kinase MtrB [Jiangellaceae bacterium]
MTSGVSVERAGGPGGRLARALSTAGVHVLRAWRRVVYVWQRSLQLRVVAATLTLSFAVVALLGITLTRQITDDLLKQQLDTAVPYAVAGIGQAQQQLNNLADEPDHADRVQIVEDLAAQDGEGGPAVVMLRPDGGTAATTTPQPADSTFPADLRARIQEEPDQLWWAYTTIEFLPGLGGEQLENQPGMVVGGQVRAPVGAAEEIFELYYVFSLEETEQTLGIVRTALWTAGLLVVLLLGAIAGLVTRQVVTPVRMAASIAGRFSAGRLSERMTVRGKDDMSKLAMSFNQMAGSLQKQIAELEELSRIQQQFASDVSHELRTPLTTVRMAADVLHESREDFDPVVQRAAELLQAQLDRFEALLSDLLEISRFDAGVAVLNAESVDMRDLVYSVTDSCNQLAGRRGSEVRIEIPAEPCVAEIDERRIERVLRNLVINAIEHGEGRDVVVRVVANDQAVAVGIRDYGVGLKPGEASLVFHRFWRADPARARTTGGTGLGLAISLEDARLHGGWLQAWGEPGGGSHFLLTLPRTAGDDIVASPLPLIPHDAMDDSGLSGVGSPYQRVADDATDGWSAEPLDLTEEVMSGAAGAANADRDTTDADDGDQDESTGDAATAAAFDVDVPDPHATFEVADEATAPDAAEPDPDEPDTPGDVPDDSVEVRRA